MFRAPPYKIASQKEIRYEIVNCAKLYVNLETVHSRRTVSKARLIECVTPVSLSKRIALSTKYRNITSNSPDGAGSSVTSRLIGLLELQFVNERLKLDSTGINHSFPVQAAVD